ncbi:flavin reductase family protein [Pseudochelatococcus sp. B33]
MSDSERQFRDVLGLFPTGVAIVTTIAPDGSPLGATVSSFNSVSLAPPLILFSIAKKAHALSIWEEAEHYAVNLLREDQSELSTRFARALSDKWSGIAPVNKGDNILLPEALAWFECSRYACHDGGDHIILVGRVTAFAAAGDSNPRPLVFYKGSYRKLDGHQEIQTPRGLDYLVHGW